MMCLYEADGWTDGGTDGAVSPIMRIKERQLMDTPIKRFADPVPPNTNKLRTTNHTEDEWGQGRAWTFTSCICV